ncbi:TetR/AcrR family transcriptional regulator [Frankia sp. CN6]|uniref:TetR/AcrR family transcriptional regulator n=1 Tax=Frankia nepalensis TaxID=1836974 RepID=A0A937RJC6_9ACTN|nr:TetR/AcrR family transcriptional regulator [Frankia nepalensis]
MRMLTPRRDDARRNREAILRVADAAFTGGSRAVPLREIARRAGLGRATVYRHFPDRHALAGAVAADYLEALREVVDGAEEDGRPFEDILSWVLSTQATMRPLTAVLREIPDQEQRQYLAGLVGILTPPFRRAQAEGRLRADAEPADLARVLVMLDAAAELEAADGARDVTMRRLIAVILAGLFTGAGDRLDQAVPGASPPTGDRTG